ncbi:MAG: leucine--tRNA ligase [Candidatus Saccharicenans sp.]|jgi:leucyl-tRNA synthetase|nr:leucine--tRNA ligase [Candidatus Saccharicenans sp.]MDH7575372.1 leucine--tRNA ligase [Candidatus Saccharicenans sp.]
MKEAYNFEQIEKKWQKIWEEKQVFEVSEDSDRPKYYLLEMYPYPSGRIHMGHVRNYSIGDVLARFKKMKGYNVLHPIGWDALGMPAENAAIKHGIHPQKWTLDNIDYMRSQLKKMGFSYCWSREVNTCLPEYYKWNQWIFLKMFEQGLAYRRMSWVNWCPQCRTVLANEQVIAGSCWRCDSQVTQKKMEQWFLKITAYADELLSGHEQLSRWPEHVLQMQKNWIGRSTGALVNFPVPSLNKAIEVFTTRIDTIYGATFLVLSPEHPLAAELVANHPDRETLKEWMARTIAESRLRREERDEEKVGYDTGVKALNPFSGELVPIFLANYVLMDYGTGAIMAVPAHDQRDYEFAVKYRLPIRTVIAPASPDVKPEEGKAFESYGVLVNSGPFNGLSSEEAMEKMAAYAKEKGFGQASVTYRLRDWGISRQRYWGTPIPIIYCDKCGVQPVPYEQLPVEIPYEAQFTGEEGSPLEKVPHFVRTTCPKCGGPARRETDTMDTFVDSSWYFFRYCSPREDKIPFVPEKARYWMPVDLYIGGVEHAILHLIYSRFFTKYLRDLGLTQVDEPFPHYLAQGMVTKDGSAMSKSRGNVVDPDDMIKRYGADALRVFILFASPPEKEFAWSEEGLEGCYRFILRIWNMFEENRELFSGEAPSAPEKHDEPSYQRLLKKLHQTIKKVSEDIELRFHLNTAISALMELVNTLKKERDQLYSSHKGRELLRQALESLNLMLAPFAPHVAEELWERTGHRTLVAESPWPAYDPELAREEMVTIVVQVNGKLRDKFEVPADTEEDVLKERALALPRIQEILSGKQPKKVVCVRNKLVSLVV